jgi:hypothetical protein
MRLCAVYHFGDAVPYDTQDRVGPAGGEGSPVENAAHGGPAASDRA